jgi:hypothetical protein
VCLTSRATTIPLTEMLTFRFIFEPLVDAQAKSRSIHLRLPFAPKQFPRTPSTRRAQLPALADCSASTVKCLSIQVSRKVRDKLSKTGFMMYSKNVRSPVLM